MEEKILNTPRGKIHYWYHEPGHPNACTLVFLHGLTADHTLFEKQAEYFRINHRLIIWDAPGHGKSRPYEGFGYANAAEDLKNLLDEEHIEQAVFIGQSMGGFVIQSFMKRYRSYVRAFIAIDSTPYGLDYYSPSDNWWLNQIGWMSALYPYSMLIRAVSESSTYTDDARFNMYHALKNLTKTEITELYDQGFKDFTEENADLVITCPTLLLVGEHDITGKVKEYNHRWHEATGFPLIIVPDAAHNSNRDNPEFVNKVIEAFLESEKLNRA